MSAEFLAMVREARRKSRKNGDRQRTRAISLERQESTASERVGSILLVVAEVLTLDVLLCLPVQNSKLVTKSVRSISHLVYICIVNSICSR